MKKLSWLLVLAMLMSMFALTASAEGNYAQSPLFDDAVASGDLPTVAERLPENPKLTNEILPEYLDYESGNYGGTMRLVTSIVNWDADGFIGNNEALLTMESANSGVITPNIVENYEANADNTVFTFTLRKGLKWSDGTEVTMDDFAFGVNSFVFNEELTPVVGSWMRDGGRSDGEPMVFEVVDDSTFTISFNESYGGFPVHLSIAGWKGYTEFLKPAHFLKQFHLDYAEEVHGSIDAYYEFIAPFAAQLAYDDATEEGVWTYVFHQVDMTNWELTDPNDALTSMYFDGLIEENFPVLYPWVMQSNEGGITTFERNPYYHKVDADGQQLPYIDYMTSTLVENMEMVQLKYMTGEADFGRESATIDNISLYRENEDTAGITAYVTTMHTNPTDVAINVNYGLNIDGTVKDDDESKAWQEVVQDVRFRQALMLAIDADEILDAVYNGFGEIHPSYDCSNDIDAANALLDELGMVDLDGDGYRESPSGLPFQWQIWNNNEANDIIPVCELLVEFWGDIGLKVGVNTTESTLLATSQEANEMPMRVSWIHTTQLWHYKDWFEPVWAPLWNTWVARGGLSGALEGSTEYLEPDDDYKQFRLAVDSLFTVDPETAVNEVLPGLSDWMSERLYIIEPLINVQQCVV
ncbi:MAG: ABC transporter substrate-binding protein, partial [Christensenellales bacterium]